MSSNSSTSGYADVSKFNMTGGFPTSKDLAPNIVFLIAYVIALPVLIWRIIVPKHRTLVLFRPSLFVVCRIGMLGLRAYMSKNTYGESELIAELILVSIGTLFLLECTVELWRRNVASAVSIKEGPRWVAYLSKLLKLAVLAAIGTAIAGAAQISSAINDPSKIQSVTHLRRISSIITFCVPIVLLIALAITHFHFQLDARRTAYIVPLAVLLFIISVYRLIQTESTNPNSDIRKQVLFWILMILPEFLVFCGFLAISIPTWYPAQMNNQVVEDEEMRTGGKSQNFEMSNGTSAYQARH